MSEFEKWVFEPNTQHLVEETVGLYAPGISSTLNNSGDRLQEIANRVGFPIIGSDFVLQKKKTIFDMKAKDANRLSGPIYTDLSRHRSEFWADVASQYGGMRVGIGDSLGVSVIQGMQLHGEEAGKFDCIVLRDGWNLSESTGSAKGIARYLGYTIADSVQGLFNKIETPKHGYEHVDDNVPDETNILQKIWNVADLMKGPENRKSALLLASMSQFTLHAVGFEHGLSGSRKQLENFFSDLHRTAVANGNNRLSTEIAPGWHSHLLDPVLSANQITTAINSTRHNNS